MNHEKPRLGGHPDTPGDQPGTELRYAKNSSGLLVPVARRARLLVPAGSQAAIRQAQRQHGRKAKLDSSDEL